jgi:hypothetical protein
MSAGVALAAALTPEEEGLVISIFQKIDKDNDKIISKRVAARWRAPTARCLCLRLCDRARDLER